VTTRAALAEPADDDARRTAIRRVVAAQFGDRAALDALLRDIQVPLFRHVAYLLGSDEAAEDALQEILLTISRKLGGLRDPRWFRAWAFRIATRMAIRHARRLRSGYALVDLEHADELEAPSEPDPPFDETELLRLRGALGEVPPASQLVLRMHYEHALTHVEIAEALGISIGTVKSRHHYGLQWLRRRMAAEQDARLTAPRGVPAEASDT
jgi:RNA polymerase sigma-70 factor (ECF subfamily)